MESVDSFLTWFKSAGGKLDPAVGFQYFDGQGRGAVALSDIPEGHTLFVIPRSICLSTRTSDLPKLFGDEQWKNYGLNKGWTGLILCMMWEEARGKDSKWEGYLNSLPTAFDTPMFWSESDLQELKGTTVVEKIGKEDAEKSYAEVLQPILEGRSDLFPSELVKNHYSLQNYHIMGSRILSRSFQVERWEGDAAEEVDKSADAMDTDEPAATLRIDGDQGAGPTEEAGVDHDGSDGSDDDEEDDPSDVAMVPMADMLNARYGTENSKLFCEARVLKMISTKAIKAGEKIWNTYGDLPNSDLLRKYGHVDLLPLPGGGEGNPADIVEVAADLVLEAVSPGAQSQRYLERIDWWLEEGGDDVFILESDGSLPDVFISFIRLILSPVPDWEKAKSKGRPPKAVMDESVRNIAIKALESRLSHYSTTIEHDKGLLDIDLPLNQRHAVIVRLSEKTILRNTIDHLQSLELPPEEKSNPKEKRKRDSEGGNRSAKGQKQSRTR